MTGGGIPRTCLVVGVSRSPASWWALAWATGEARRRAARLLLVHVYRPGTFAAADLDPGRCAAGAAWDPDASRVEYGYMLIRAAVAQALGQLPGDVMVEQAVVPGHAAGELIRLAGSADVLVLGARHRGWLRRHSPGSVARACARRAECPVVIIPEPSPGAVTESLPIESDRGHWFRREPHH